MLHFIYEERNEETGESSIEVTTTGCGCCSRNLYVGQDDKEIERQFEQLIETVKEACRILKKDPKVLFDVAEEPDEDWAAEVYLGR